MNYNNVIDKIIAQKKQLKLTTNGLSLKSGIPVGTLNKILTKKTQSVKIGTMSKLLNALGLPLFESDGTTLDSNLSKDYGFVKVATVSSEVRVCDVEFNVSSVIKNIKIATEKGAQVIVFPELCITGFTCGDMFFQETLLTSAKRGLLDILNCSKLYDSLIFVGMPLRRNGVLYSVAVCICKGEILAFVPKANVCNNDLQSRFFKGYKGDNTTVVFNGKEYLFGTNIIFASHSNENFTVSAEISSDLEVPVPPSTHHSQNGANLIVNLSSSYEILHQQQKRQSAVVEHSKRNIVGYAYANCGFGESSTDYVFSGHSLICECGTLLCESKQFSYSMQIADIDVDYIAYEKSRNYRCVDLPLYRYETVYFSTQIRVSELSLQVCQTPFIPRRDADYKSNMESIFNMLAYGLLKRVKHTNPKTLILGLSGGLDSTLAILVAMRTMKELGRSFKDIIAVTMPCFGTTERTKNNAKNLASELGVTLMEIDISKAVEVHFKDIGHNKLITDVTFENSQARERTQVLMDLSNKFGGIVLGTGDMSELALGWATYNGDHMSMYAVNSSIPKTLVKELVRYEALRLSKKLCEILKDILDTPVSPELIPHNDGEIKQKTEDIVGPYLLHDFYIYYALKKGYRPSKILFVAEKAFESMYDKGVLIKWLKNFYNRFFSQQFKRSCMPDGVKTASVGLSPRGDLCMPSDAVKTEWLRDLENL